MLAQAAAAGVMADHARNPGVREPDQLLAVASALGLGAADALFGGLTYTEDPAAVEEGEDGEEGEEDEEEEDDCGCGCGSAVHRLDFGGGGGPGGAGPSSGLVA